MNKNIVALLGRAIDTLREIQLEIKKQDPTETDVLEEAIFVYESMNTGIRWRYIGVTREDTDYIEGLDRRDGDKYKVFRKDKVLDGKILKD